MKHSLIAILFIALAIPCSAQWKATGTNIEIVAIAPHDSSLFLSSPDHIIRFNPLSGDADVGIGWGYGNITTFASLGRYFFANEGSVQATYETSNNGSSWDYATGAANSVASNGYYLFGTNSPPFTTEPPYVVRSTDSGKNWDSVSNFNNGNWGIYFATNGACIYSNPGSSLWRSLDTGSIGSWKQLPAPPFVGTMLTMDSLLFMYQNYRSDGNGELIVSPDSGMTWDTIAIDSAGIPEKITCLATDGRNLFAGGFNTSTGNTNTEYGSGVFVSTDRGRTWRAENDGLGFFEIGALGVYDTMLYAAEGGSGPLYGTYFRPIDEMTDTTKSMVVQSVSASDSIEIYPNPASGLVTILAGGTSIYGVSVLNVLGSETGPGFRGPGSGTVTLDLSKEPSGTYFVRIQTEAGSVLKKITLER